MSSHFYQQWEWQNLFEKTSFWIPTYFTLPKFLKWKIRPSVFGPLKGGETKWFKKLGFIQIIFSHMNDAVSLSFLSNLFPFILFFLSLVFRNVTMMCHDVIVFEFILFGVCLASWICKIIPVAKSGKFSGHYLFKYIFNPTLFSHFPMTLMTQMSDM